MSINREMLVLARECRGWTQKELGKAIGVTQTAVGKYEHGLMKFPASELDRLSEALDFVPEFFLQRPLRVAPGGDFLYRRKANVSAKVRRRVAAEANIRMMQVERLLQKVELESHNVGFPAIEPEERLGKIERIAQDVREAWRVPEGPISNVTGYVERAGGIIFAVDFETDLIDGTNVRMPGLPPMLFLNEKVSGDRHRFNIAHELGHTVMHFGLVDGDAEAQANQFAQEFLMPRAQVRSDLRNLDLKSAARLKLVWGVSMAALIVRARDLKVITESRYRSLFSALSARGMRSIEPINIPFEEPRAFASMLESHRRDLGMDDDDIRRLLFTDRLGPRPPSPPSPPLRLFREN